jgi:hypothetical protein
MKDTYKNYTNFLFNAILDNAYTNVHHIIPRSCGGTDDPDNLIKLTPAQHAYAHYLWDKEYGTNTFQIFAHRLGITDLSNVTYEDCLPYNIIDKERALHVSEAQKASWKDEWKSAQRRQHMSEAKLGKVNVCVNRIWINDGETRRRVNPDTELPEGWTVGYKL